MSYCRKEGKDTVIFVTKEEHQKPSTAAAAFAGDLDDEPGLILDNGEINWNCPCLGGMATGPCGFEFREAFSCFHYSQEEMKGSDCYEQFKSMQDCMSKYPDLYEPAEKDNNDLDPLEDETDSKTMGDESSVEEKSQEKNS